MATMARGRLSLPPLLRLPLSPDMATTAMDMATDTVTDTVMDMVMATDTDTTATTARGPLMLMPTTATEATEDTVMDTATDTAMATATMVEREQTVLTIMM